MSANVVPFRSGEPPSQRLISRLSKVKTCGKDRWLACCPAHEDKDPSLSVRELNDGTVLIKCFAGCSAADIVGAIGLELRDLFVGQPHDRKAGRPNHYHASRMAMQMLHKECLIVAIAAGNIAQGVTLTPEDLERVQDAAERVRSAIEACL